MNQEEIRNMFNKFDVNGDGSITKEAFLQAVQEHNLVTDASQIDHFMEKIDTDKDGKVSFEEFSYFVTFHKSELSEYKFLLDLTSSSLGYAKKLEKIVDIKAGDNENPTTVKVVFRDQEAKSIDDMHSFVQVHVGDYENHEHIPKVLKHNFESSGVVGMKFHVKNREMIKNNFTEYIQALKDFLGELGPEAAQIINSLDIQLLDVEDGVILAIDAASHPFVSIYMDLLKMKVEQVQNLKSSFSLMVGFGENIADKNMTYEQLIDSNFYFELSSRAVKLSHLAQSGPVKSILQLLNSNKESKGALLGLLCALSFKSATAEILLNSTDRKEFIKDAEIQDLNEPVWNNHFENANNQLTQSGMNDFIDSLDFIKQSMRDLKEAECTSVSFFLKAHGVYVVKHVKADVYPVLDQLLGLN